MKFALFLFLIVQFTNSIASPRSEEWLVYSSNMGGNQDLYLHNLNTSEVIKILDIEGDVFYPSFSNSGNEFLSEGQITKGDSNILLYSNDNKLSLNTLTYYKGWDAYPHWSPDDSAVVFTSARNNFAGLYIYNVKTGLIKAITSTEEDAYFGRWHQDGSTILYHRRLKKGHEYPLNVVTKNLKTGEIKNLTDWKGNEKYANWSPDFKEIVFEADRDGSGDLYIKNLQTGNTEKITHSPEKERHGSFNADGTKITYIVDYGKYNEVFVYDRKTKLSKQITFNKSKVWHPYFVKSSLVRHFIESDDVSTL